MYYVMSKYWRQLKVSIFHSIFVCVSKSCLTIRIRTRAIAKRLKNVVLSEKLSETIQSYKLTRRRKTKELRLSTLGLYGCEIVRADNKIAASSAMGPHTKSNSKRVDESLIYEA